MLQQEIRTDKYAFKKKKKKTLKNFVLFAFFLLLFFFVLKGYLHWVLIIFKHCVNLGYDEPSVKVLSKILQLDCTACDRVFT